MSSSQRIIVIAILALVTMLTRALPFFIFSAGKSSKETPKYIQYLGRVLPLAVFGMLVVYCLKDITWNDGMHGIPEVAGIVAVVLAHLWRRQLFLSMVVGTVVYMVLIRVLV